jgi:hypothetical protein
MVISSRLKGLAATGILAGGLGIAAINGAFAAPPAAPGTPTAVASPVGAQPGARPQNGERGFFGKGFFGGGFIGPIATYLGISTSDLQTALNNGQTLAQIAQAHGKTSADLKNLLMNQESQRIDQLLTTNFQQLRAQRSPGGPGGPGFSGIATYLGINQSDLQTALQGGQTLAQVAQAHGKSAADLKTFLVSQLKTRLDQAVSAGRLTSQQETDQLNQASTRIDQMINTPGTQLRLGRGFGRRGPGGQPGPGANNGQPTPTATAASA